MLDAEIVACVLYDYEADGETWVRVLLAIAPEGTPIIERMVVAGGYRRNAWSALSSAFEELSKVYRT